MFWHLLDIELYCRFCGEIRNEQSDDVTRRGSKPEGTHAANERSSFGSFPASLCRQLLQAPTMSNNIELDDLSQPKGRSRPTEDSKDESPRLLHSPETRKTEDGSTSLWAWTLAATFALFSLCLTLFPRFLLFLAEESGGRGKLTSLEEYLALQLGILLGIVSLAAISMIPNEWPASPSLTAHQDKSHPLLWPMTGASLLMAFTSYRNPSVGALATTVLWGSGIIGFFGLWLVIFGGSSAAISRKTGADKHTSTFIFGNKNAASARKKMWKNEYTPSKEVSTPRH